MDKPRTLHEAYQSVQEEISRAIMRPESIELECGCVITIDKDVKSVRQVDQHTVQLYTPKLGGGGIGGQSKVGVIKLGFSSPIVSIK